MTTNSFKVNENTCVRCGLCVSDCVCTIIEMEDIPFIAPTNLEKCIRCGHCQAICPTSSITLNGIAPEALPAAERPTTERIIESVIKNRRSVRNFSKDPVDKNILEKVIDIAAWAPIAINMRDMGFVIFNGREKVVNLMDACAAVMEKYGLFPELAARIRKGDDALFRGAPCVLAIYAPDRPYSISDCATTLAAIELSLPSFGLAS